MPVPPSPIAISLGSWDLRWYSILIALSLAVALVICVKELERRGMNADFFIDTMLWVLPAGIIGARAYYIFFHWDIYKHLPLSSVIAVWEGGIAIHGALFAGIPVAWLYASRKKVNLLPYLDVAMACMALAQAIGRWGNWFNREAYGAPTDLPWGMVIDGVAYHPAFLYESLWNLLLFAVLWRVLHRYKDLEGFTSACYLLGYSMGRLWIEELRMDSEWIGPLKAASVWSVLGICIGGLLIYTMLRRNRLHAGKNTEHEE